MKNIQVIDGADNCTYDIFTTTDEDFSLIFPPSEDVAFIEEVYARADVASLEKALTGLWTRRVRKTDAIGIHGTLFYGLLHKKSYYPRRSDEDARNPDGTLLR